MLYGIPRYTISQQYLNESSSNVSTERTTVLKMHVRSRPCYLFPYLPFECDEYE